MKKIILVLAFTIALLVPAAVYASQSISEKENTVPNRTTQEYKVDNHDYRQELWMDSSENGHSYNPQLWL